MSLSPRTLRRTRQIVLGKSSTVFNGHFLLFKERWTLIIYLCLAHRSFRKVVKESDLDYQSALKRDRDLESDGEAEEDEYKLDRPSAFNKLFGLLKKSSKRQDEWKKRKLEEEGLEDMEDEDEVEEEGEDYFAAGQALCKLDSRNSMER